MKLQPLHDRVIIKRLESETKTAGGIVIPDTAKEKPMKGEVIAVGKGRTLDNGQVLVPSVKAGDTVLIGKYAGSEFKIDDVEYVAVKEDEIIAIVGGK
jgi:chaperonin GroES